jgi:hypothetical protein
MRLSVSSSLKFANQCIPPHPQTDPIRLSALPFRCTNTNTPFPYPFHSNANSFSLCYSIPKSNPVSGAVYYFSVSSHNDPSLLSAPSLELSNKTTVKS